MYHNTRKTEGRPGGICNIKKRSEDAVLGYGVYQVTKDDCEKCVLGRSGGGIPSDRYGSELLQRRGGEKRYKEIRAIFCVHGAERNMAAKAAPPRCASRGKDLPCPIDLRGGGSRRQPIQPSESDRPPRKPGWRTRCPGLQKEGT